MGVSLDGRLVCPRFGVLAMGEDIRGVATNVSWEVWHFVLSPTELVGGPAPAVVAGPSLPCWDWTVGRFHLMRVIRRVLKD